MGFEIMVEKNLKEKMAWLMGEVGDQEVNCKERK